MEFDNPPWHDQGYQITKWLDDGRAAGLQAQLFSVNICVGSAEDIAGYSEAYWYDNAPTAVIQFLKWNGEGEPEGWIRHTPSNRRRTGGDPATEYIAP
jgi:hypothetical protein